MKYIRIYFLAVIVVIGIAFSSLVPVFDPSYPTYTMQVAIVLTHMKIYILGLVLIFLAGYYLLRDKLDDKKSLYTKLLLFVLIFVSGMVFFIITNMNFSANVGETNSEDLIADGIVGLHSLIKGSILIIIGFMGVIKLFPLVISNITD